MRKFLVIAIPIVALGLFICIMLSGSFLKKPFGQEEDIEQSIERIKVNINNEKWEYSSVRYKTGTYEQRGNPGGNIL